LRAVDPKGAHDVVVNLQGDLPALDPDQLKAAVWALAKSGADIGTLAAPIQDEAEETNPAVVKAVVAWDADERLGRALYFTRASAPAGEGVLWHHVGLYAYRRDALESFVALPPSPLELREKLEQLRALEAGMSIAVARVDATPLSVDTPADLERARKLLS
jgi:3-deoxy-manno-octulosonate cytidylyltransferase (CMP-KDO synthetase)